MILTSGWFRGCFDSFGVRWCLDENVVTGEKSIRFITIDKVIRNMDGSYTVAPLKKVVSNFKAREYDFYAKYIEEYYNSPECFIVPNDEYGTEDYGYGNFNITNEELIDVDVTDSPVIDYFCDEIESMKTNLLEYSKLILDKSM